MRHAFLTMLTASLLSLAVTSCSAQDDGDRVLRVETEVRILQVTYAKTDVKFWWDMIGQEVFPGLVLAEIKPQQDCGDHVHSIFILKSAEALKEEQEQQKAKPEPQRGRAQEREPSAFA